MYDLWSKRDAKDDSPAIDRSRYLQKVDKGRVTLTLRVRHGHPCGDESRLPPRGLAILGAEDSKGGTGRMRHHEFYAPSSCLLPYVHRQAALRKARVQSPVVEGKVLHALKVGVLRVSWCLGH